MNDATKLTRQTLAATLLDQLRQQILSGRQRPGSTLPTEKAIGLTFGVGRTTVREALQGLLAAGIVVRHGGRLVVVDASDLPAGDREQVNTAARVSLHDIFETRKLIEVEGARLAALRHSKADLAKLRRLVRHMEPADPVGNHMRSQQFHVAIATMSGNEVLALVVERSADLLFGRPFPALPGDANGALSSRLVTDVRQSHERIVAAIASGSAPASAQAMYEYLDDLEKALAAGDNTADHSAAVATDEVQPGERPGRRPRPGRVPDTSPTTA